MSCKNGGGIMLPYSKQELSKKIFTNYLNNFNKIHLLSFGTYGIVLLLLLPLTLAFATGSIPEGGGCSPLCGQLLRCTGLYMVLLYV